MQSDDKERLKELEKKVLDLLESSQDFSDKDIRRALVEVARSYVWRQGFFERLRYAANIIGILGIIGGAVVAVMTILGVEVSIK